jgi:hypothetical protein
VAGRERWKFKACALRQDWRDFEAGSPPTLEIEHRKQTSIMFTDTVGCNALAHRDDRRFGQLLERLDCRREYQVARETLARLRKEQERARP